MSRVAFQFVLFRRISTPWYCKWIVALKWEAIRDVQRKRLLEGHASLLPRGRVFIHFPVNAYSRAIAYRISTYCAFVFLIQAAIRSISSSVASPTQPSVVSNHLRIAPNHLKARGGPCIPTALPV